MLSRKIVKLHVGVKNMHLFIATQFSIHNQRSGLSLEKQSNVIYEIPYSVVRSTLVRQIKEEIEG